MIRKRPGLVGRPIEVYNLVEVLRAVKKNSWSMLFLMLAIRFLEKRLNS
jgi:hypothetical protein